MDFVLDSFSKPVMLALPKLPVAILTFMVGYLVLWTASQIIRSLFKLTGMTKAVNQILRSIINVLMWAVLLALVFQSLGLPQVALALSGSVAIFGIFMASGANFLVTDILSGFFLAKDPDFNVGVRIKTADFEGVIEHIDLRKVRVRDNDKHLHVIPNSVLDKAQFIVLDENAK